MHVRFENSKNGDRKTYFNNDIKSKDWRKPYFLENMLLEFDAINITENVRIEKGFINWYTILSVLR